MADNIHASKYKPRFFPIKGDVEPAEIDRAQDITPDTSTNREAAYEIGREENNGLVGYLATSPEISYDLTQNEYGSIEFYQLLAGNDTLGNIGETGITLDNFKTTYGDIVAYLTDDGGTFVGTAHYPGLRLSSLGVSIPGPQDIIERSFTLDGNNAYIWQGDNKYFIYKKHTCSSPSDTTIDLSDKSPEEDPIEENYMYRVVLYDTSEETTTELTSSQYSYDSGTEELTISATVDTGDIVKVYYTSSTAPDTMFTKNDADIAGMLGDSVSIYLYVPASGKPDSDDYVYRLQSVDVTADFDREDLRELGNRNIVQRGVSDNTVTVDIERQVETFTVEEIFAGKAPGFGKIDVNKFSDDITLIVKFYETNAKDNFSYGIKCTGLTPTDLSGGASIQEYITRSGSLEGKNMTISEDTSVLGI